MEDVQDTEKQAQNGLAVITEKQGRTIEALLAGQVALPVIEEQEQECVSAEIIRRKTSSVSSVEDDVAGDDMRTQLVRAGLSPAHLANVLREGLACRKHVVIKGVMRKIPDYALRLKYLDLAHRLRGDLTGQVQQGSTVTYEERIRMIMQTVHKPVDNS